MLSGVRLVGGLDTGSSLLHDGFQGLPAVEMISGDMLFDMLS